jgi:hypothetical protein
MNNEKILPVVIKKEQWKLLLGFVKIQYLIEDRRPDLSEHVQSLTKYKHSITILVGWKRFNWTFHTKHTYENLPNISDKVK